MFDESRRKFGVVVLTTAILSWVFLMATAALAENDSEYIRTNRAGKQQANHTYSNAQAQTPARTGEVYLIRGLANIFSLGMDEIEVKLENKGVEAKTFNHSGWKGVADNIIQRAKRNEVSYPIVIAGHSLGANSTVSMANYLAEHGIEVSLVVAYDPTMNRIVGKDIDKVINYHFPNGHNDFEKGPGFNGSLENVDVSDMKNLGHMNVEKSTELQDKFIAEVMNITHKRKNK
jgi:hypothetical protein